MNDNIDALITRILSGCLGKKKRTLKPHHYARSTLHIFGKKYRAKKLWDKTRKKPGSEFYNVRLATETEQ